MTPALWQVTSRQWRTHRLRVAMTTLGIALGVAVFFAVRTANAALLDSLTLTVERLAGKSTLEVTAGETGFPEETLDTVRATPGVQLAEPVIEVIVHTAFQDEGNLLILGVDTTGDQQLRQYEFDRSQSQIGDPLTYLADPRSILLSQAFADRHGLHIGDHLPLFTSHGKMDFTVQGLFKPTGVGEVFGGNIAVMDIYSAQTVFGRGHNFDRIDLMNTPAVPVEELQKSLHARLPAGIEVMRPEMAGQALANAVTAMRLGMLITSFIALLVGVYIIFNSFTIAVNQRWKEIGILRAIGVERGKINAMFMGEAAIMGVVGSGLGIAVGYYLASGANRVMGSVAASVYGIVSTAVAPRLHADLVLTSLALGVAASLGGAWFPARAASYLDPILALHNIEARQRESAVGFGRTALGITLLAISMLLIQYSPSGVGLVFEFSYAALMLLGLTILLPTLVHWAARAIRPAMDFVGGSEGALAVDAMIQSPRRSAATVGALMVGLMFVFSTASYIQSYKHMIDRWTREMLNADLVVATSTLLRSTSYHFSEDLGNRIAALPEVQRVENVRFTIVPYRDDTAAIAAQDMDGFLARSANAVLGGNRKTVNDLLPRGQGVLVSKNFAARWRARVGDRVHLNTPTGALDLPILGLVEDYRSDKGTIFLDRAVYKHFWKDDAVDFVDITLKPGESPPAVKQEIQRLTAGSEHAIVYTNSEFRNWIGSLVDTFFILNYMQLVVAVIVAVVGIANTLIISVAERRREFGIVRAIGGYCSQIRRMVLLEAFSISVVGVIVGAIAALFNIQFMSHTVSTILAGYDVPFYFPWKLILEAFPAVIAVSLLAGWIPARHAMQVPVIEAIGYE
ncbi:MAG TPA: FtsX-like permease family protein [Acidobacteriaceae bacterium]|jgi:putative ABC transport system permease protein